MAVSRPAVGFLLVMAALLLAAFAVLAIVVDRHPGPLPDDVGLTQAVQHALLPHTVITSVVDEDSTLNFPVPATIGVVIIVGVLALLRHWLASLMVAGTSAVGDGSRLLVSDLIHRPRPSGHGLHIAGLPRSYSFPSGHVTHAVAVFGLLVFLSFRVRRPTHSVALWALRLLALVVILLMPVSRLLEGEHWPSDVLAGALYGAFWLLIAIAVYRWLRWRRDRA